MIYYLVYTSFIYFFFFFFQLSSRFFFTNGEECPNGFVEQIVFISIIIFILLVLSFLLLFFSQATKIFDFCLFVVSFQYFSGNHDRNTVRLHSFIPAIRGRYIRVHPWGWHAHISMRLEFYGCRIGKREHPFILLTRSKTERNEDLVNAL